MEVVALAGTSGMGSDAEEGHRQAEASARGNPQIPKGEGDAPVQAYIAAMPGWNRDAGRRLDALIVKAVPKVHKAVKWNSPLYGIADGEGWFLSYHCFDRYIKVTFFRGTSLRPVPPRGPRPPRRVTSTSTKTSSTRSSSRHG